MRSTTAFALIAGLLLLAAATDARSADACTSGTPTCSEWVAVGAGRTLVYRTYPLDVPNPAITRALVIVHGYGRNANSYFRTAVEAARRAGALADTIIVAPRFSSRQGNCYDDLAPQELGWICSGRQSWRNGGAAVDDGALTSYDAGDAIMRRVARKDIFPNLQSLVLAGHSAGGQYVGRYAMSNRVHDELGVAVSYVIANPSSYTYPDRQRPVSPSADCPAFDEWPYGLKKRSGYTARYPDEQLIRQLMTRATSFLLGELDVLPRSNFDASCPAMAQGPNRFARGVAYVKHVNETLGARHPAIHVSACGHSARCMFTAEQALPVLFP